MSRSKRNKITKHIFSFWSIISLSIICLLTSAILQINAYIHQNSIENDYQKRIAQLSAKNDELMVQLSQSNSLEKFNEYEIAQIGNYEKVDVARIRYIQAPTSQFAQK